MIPMDTNIGIGPWSINVGPFAILIVIAIIGLVVYAIRKGD